MEVSTRFPTSVYQYIDQPAPASASASVIPPSAYVIPPSASAIPGSDIISREDTYDFFVNVESSTAYDSLDSFQAICQKIINEKNITNIRTLDGEKFYAYNNVKKMIESYNENKDVKLILVGKKSKENSSKHRFTTFKFKKGNKRNAYIPEFNAHYGALPDFRPLRKKLQKSGKKVSKKSGKVRKNKKSKKSRN
jgi:hypothetical protein